MVDTEPRQRAAELIEKLRDGTISNFDFEESWPRYDKRDRALRAIETMIWRFYSDGHEHTLAEEGHLLTAEGREIFDRCVLFLRTGLEYQWPKDNFIGIGGLGDPGPKTLSPPRYSCECAPVCARIGRNSCSRSRAPWRLFYLSWC